MKRDYKNLEIVSGKEKRVTTGLDCSIICDGEDLVKKLKIQWLDWSISDKDGEIAIKTDTEVILVDYPIKSMIIHTKAFTIETDNTSKGTKLYYNDKDVTSEWGIASLRYAVGDAGTVSELEMIVC